MVQIRIINAKKALKQLDDFKDSLAGRKGIGKLSAEMNKVFKTMELELFRTEGGSGRSGKWKQLSPKYRKWKEKHYPGRRILVRKGRLKRALTGKSDELRFRITGMGSRGGLKFHWVTSVPYFKYHQKGTNIIPQRKAFDVSNKYSRRFLKVIHKNVVVLTTANGFFKAVTIKSPKWDRF